MKRIFLLSLLLLSLRLSQAQEEAVALAVPDCTLHGTLAMPEGGSDTAVLIIAGSGPTDRNGNNPLGVGARPYALLADFLAGDGIASLRYDKRGIAASELSRERSEQVVLEDYIDDARLLARYLKRERRFRRVVLAGHSEGALIAFVAAAGNPDIDAVVSLCGPGYPMDVLLKKQIGRQTEELGLTKTLQIYAIVDTLKAGRIPQIPADLAQLFPASVLPFVISSFRYDPAEWAARVSQPMLLVSGGRDLQVGPENAEALLRAQPSAETVLIEDMTHVLKPCDSMDIAVQMAVYRNGDTPLSTALPDALHRFLQPFVGRKR